MAPQNWRKREQRGNRTTKEKEEDDDDEEEEDEDDEDDAEKATRDHHHRLKTLKHTIVYQITKTKHTNKIKYFLSGIIFFSSRPPPGPEIQKNKTQT